MAAVMAGDAFAGQCQQKQLVSVPATIDQNGAVLVPAFLHDSPSELAVDTGAYWGVIKQSLVGDLPIRTAAGGVVGVGGIPTRRFVSVPDLRIGSLQLGRADFFIEPDSFAPNPQVGGILAANLLAWADLEIDPGSRKVALFSHDHCRGQVIYWPHRAAFSVAMRVEKSGHLTIPVGLNGHGLWAMIDTGASISVLDADVAKRLFGLQPGDPDVEPAGEMTTVEGARIPVFRHQFSTLTMEGVTFWNPWIVIGENKGKRLPALRRAEAANGDVRPDLILGMHQLRNLHLYFAYGEKTLYGTSVMGDAAAARAAPAP